MSLRTDRILIARIACLCFGAAFAVWVRPASGADSGVVTPAMNELVQRQQAFTWALYAQQRATPENLLLSPYSVATALAMAMEGARGKTATEMAATLHLADWDEQKRLTATRQLLDRLIGAGPARPYTLTIANTLWLPAGISLRPDFERVCRLHYANKVQGLDFAHPAVAAQTINAWVAKATDQHIPEVITADALPDNIRFVLTNVIYFKGQWVHPFSPTATQPRPWLGPPVATADANHPAPSAPRTVPMMQQAVTLGYSDRIGERDGPSRGQVVELPYIGGRLAMVILLPSADNPAAHPGAATNMERLEADLAAGKLNDWLSHLAPTKIDLNIPRFTCRTQVDLNKVLAAQGMPTAFDKNAADFTGISGDDRPPEVWYIAKVSHTAMIEVNEDGTVAAAATSVYGSTSSASESRPALVMADHPFIYLIRDRQSGAILFLGRLVQP